jgi:site-specific DNA-methyltransferase (adenine-specific)
MPTLAGTSGKGEKVDHPTQKPLELCEKLLKSCKQDPENGFVLIPFAGSGSECVAAKKLGLPFMGVEINEEYVKLIEKRIEDQGSFNSTSSKEIEEDGNQLNK